MTRLVAGLAAGFAALASFSAQSADISLPAPDLSLSVPLMQALNTRHSTKEFPGEAVEPQQLSNLLWAAFGVREKGGRTAPSALNRQEVTIYVVTKEGSYAYDAAKNLLRQVSSEDNRALVAGRQKAMANAPLALVYVADATAFPAGERSLRMIAIDTGHISQNALLYCAAAGLACRPRATMDDEALVKALSLRPSQIAVMNTMVGTGR